jgi:hypothetical protein
MPKCDGTEDLKFYLGSTPRHVRRVKAAHFNDPLAFSWTDVPPFSVIKPRRAMRPGFIWLAPGGTPSQGWYENPEWNTNPTALRGILLHEVGHVYGLDDDDGGDIMDRSIKRIAQPTYDSTWRRDWMRNIDFIRQAIVCVACAFDYPGVLGWDHNGKDSPAGFSFLMGRSAQGEIQAEIKGDAFDSTAKLIVSDDLGSAEFPLHIALPEGVKSLPFRPAAIWLDGLESKVKGDYNFDGYVDSAQGKTASIQLLLNNNYVVADLKENEQSRTGPIEITFFNPETKRTEVLFKVWQTEESGDQHVVQRLQYNYRVVTADGTPIPGARVGYTFGINGELRPKERGELQTDSTGTVILPAKDFDYRSIREEAWGLSFRFIQIPGACDAAPVFDAKEPYGYRDAPSGTTNGDGCNARTPGPGEYGSRRGPLSQNITCKLGFTFKEIEIRRRISQEICASRSAQDLALVESVQNMNVAGVQAALAGGANPNLRFSAPAWNGSDTNRNDWNPLFWVTYHGDSLPDAAVQIVQALLAAHADPNARMRDFETPLYYAISLVKDGHRIAEALLDAGADINTQDGTGMTPLMKSICQSSLPWLLEKEKGKIDFSLRLKNGRGVLESVGCDVNLYNQHRVLLIAAGATPTS